MEIEFEKSKNELLKRTNVFVKIRSPKTPSKEDLQKKIASVLAVDNSLVVVDKISQVYGSNLSNAYVKVYDDLETLKRLELNHNIRKLLKEEKEKQEALKLEKKSKASKAEAEPKVEAEPKAEAEPKEETKDESLEPGE